jgi:hypothetical protein
VRIIKSHVFGYHLNYIKETWPDCPIVLVDRTDDACLGWWVSATGTESIVTRAPTHEPYPYHNQGVSVSVNLEQGQTTPPPAAPEIPSGWRIAKQ